MTGAGYSSGYSVADFVPFTAEVYSRLLERVGEAYWPLHLPAVGIGLAALALALFGRARLACLLLVLPWAWAGTTFLMQRYGELNWAGVYFGWAFVAQAGLLLLLATAWGRGRIPEDPTRTWTAARWIGLAIAVFGLVIYPLIAPLSGHGWARAETISLHPDPTAIATLGVLLVGLRGWRLWLTALVPIGWCLVTGLTLYALGSAWAVAVFVAAGVVVAGISWKTLRGG